MVALGITSIVALVALSLVLWTIHQLKPEKVHLKATLTRWLSIDLEMQNSKVSEALDEEAGSRRSHE